MTEHSGEDVQSELVALLAEHRIDLAATLIRREAQGSGNYWLFCTCGHRYSPHEDEVEWIDHLASVVAKWHNETLSIPSDSSNKEAVDE